MQKSSQIISAAMTLALGILFIILKADVIGIAITVLGIALIIAAILDIIRKDLATGIVKALIAVAVLVIGWLLLDVAIKILGIALLIYGILELAKAIVAVVNKEEVKILPIILSFVQPVLYVVASIFLILNTGSAIQWTIIVAGILLIVDAVIALVGALLPDKN